MDDPQKLATKKNIGSLLILAILILAIPLGIRLVRQQQILKSKAATASATFVPPNVEVRTGSNGPVTVATQSAVGLELVPPDGWSLTAPPPSSTPTLIAEWKLDDGSGTTMTDSAGTSNGTYIGGDAIWKSGTDCISGGCLQFDSIFQDYVQIPDSALKPQKITVSVWAKSTNPNWNQFGWLVSNRNGYIMHPNGNIKSMTFYVFVNDKWNYATYFPPSTFDIKLWHSYIGTYDGSSVKLYVDGQLKDTKSGVSGSIAFNNPNDQYLTIGKDDNTDGGTDLTRYGDGFVDEIRIYNGALNASEVSALYNSYPK